MKVSWVLSVAVQGVRFGRRLVARTHEAALIVIVGAMVLAGCSDQGARGKRSTEQNQALEWAVYHYLFGADRSNPTSLARKEVARFASGNVWVKQAPRFRSEDYKRHARIIEEVFSLVGIDVVDCEAAGADCTYTHQAVALSLRDDAVGSLNRLANEFVFAAGKLDVTSETFQQRPQDPLLDRNLGNTCVAGFTVDSTATSKHMLNGIIINIEPPGETRLQCTAEKALFMLGLYPAADVVSTASKIVATVLAESRVDRSFLSDDARRALDVLYSNQVHDSLKASEVSAVVESFD